MWKRLAIPLMCAGLFLVGIKLWTETTRSVPIHAAGEYQYSNRHVKLVIPDRAIASGDADGGRLNERVTGADTLPRCAAAVSAAAAHSEFAASQAEIAKALQEKFDEIEEVLDAEEVAEFQVTLDVELDEVVSEVGLTETQRQAALAVTQECARMLANGRPIEECSRAFFEGVEALLTAEQKARLTARRDRQRDERVDESARWTVAMVNQACGLDGGQRERIQASLLDYYAALWTNFQSRQRATIRTSYDPEELKRTIRAELLAGQLANFDQWFESHLNSAAE